MREPYAYTARAAGELCFVPRYNKECDKWFWALEGSDIDVCYEKETRAQQIKVSPGQAKARLERAGIGLWARFKFLLRRRP